MTREEKEVYLGPQSRGEQALDRFGNLDGTGDADYGDGREDPGGETGGAAVASDRRHAGQKGADAPSWQIGSNASDQSADQVSDAFRSPELRRQQQGAEAPRTNVSTPDRWESQEQARRRPETYRDEVRGVRSGDEADAPSFEVAVGQRLVLPPAALRTSGHVGPRGALASIGGRSLVGIDWRSWEDTADFTGITPGQMGPPGSLPPEPEPAVTGQSAAPVPEAPRRFREPVHLAAWRVKEWLRGVFGPPEDVPRSVEPR